jgi:hypothetical protein
VNLPQAQAARQRIGEAAHVVIGVPAVFHHDLGVGQISGQRLAMVDDMQIVAITDSGDYIFSPGGEKLRFRGV